MSNPYLNSTAFGPTPGGAKCEFDVTSKTLIKTGRGVVFRVFVNTAPSADGGVYDASAAANTAASNMITNVPQTEGPREVIAPFYNGLVIDPGTGGVVTVSYE